MALIACGAVQLAGWIGLTALSKDFAYELDNDGMPTMRFFLIQAVLGIVLLWGFNKCKRLVHDKSFVVILGVALLLRLAAMPGEPIHESDFYRYLWDGKVAKNGINPYRFEPGALLLAEKEFDFDFKDKTTGVTWRGRQFSSHEHKLLQRLATLRDENPTYFERVSHPAVTTIYPPFAQSVFWFSQLCFGDSIPGLKAIIILFDLGASGLIILILQSLGRPLIGAVLYAWNPLVIKEIANSAHYDSVAIFFMLLAVYLALRRDSALRKAIWIGLAIAGGTLTKYFAILLLPCLLIAIHTPMPNFTSRPGQIRAWCLSMPIWLGIVVFFLTTITGFLPYLIWDQAGCSEVFRGLLTYQEHWQYGPGLFALLEKGASLFFEDGFRAAKITAAFLLCGTVIYLSIGPQSSDVCRKCFVIMAALFVLSPTAFPWYFCWVLAFVPFQERSSWIILGILLPLNYLDFHTLGNIPLAGLQWHGLFVTQIFIWVLFLLTWINESVRRHFI